MIEKWVRTPAVLAILIFFYSLFLWKMSVPMTGDQKVYLTIAMEMKEKGELLVPYLFGKPNFLKPPFQYWATLAGWKIFGFNLFGALFPSVLALVGSAVLVKRISGSSSWVPAIFFGSTLASMTYGTTAQMEIWVVLFYLLAWMFALRNSPGLALIVVGMLAWIKGPLYSVLWVFGWVTYLGFQGRIREIISWKLLAKIVLGVAVGLSWFWLAAQRFPDEVIGVFFKRENLEKLNTPQGSAIGLWSEFLATLLPLLPWLLISLMDAGQREKIWGRRAFLISFSVFPALFFTFFPYRVGTYLYILTPLMVWFMSEQKLRITKPGRLILGIVALIGIFMSVFLLRMAIGSWVSLGLALFGLGSVLFWMAAHLRLETSWIALSSLMLANAIRLGGVEIGNREILALKSALAGSTAPLSYLMEREDIWHEVGLISTVLGKRIYLLREGREINPWLESGGKVILSDDQAELAVGLSCQEWSRLKRRMKFPLRELILEGLSSDRPEMLRKYLVCGRPET
jgi:4-amino-4-deoxy-L-arabinose transferase-like glycosyltransferase